jgi:hypothetical protein
MEVVGYPDYLIYKDGRVWSKKSNKFLKQKKDKYYRLGIININGERKFKLIHRLIAEHYIPNFENKPEVDHMNRDCFDNRIENLRWVDRKENQENRGTFKNNTSGHKYISWTKPPYNGWKFQFQGKYKKNRCFKSKTDAICYKFIYLLKIKSLK